MIIALDGPAGSGKSTIAKELAKDLQVEYLDTGAMYRAMTLFLLRNNVELTDSEAVANAIKDVIINVDGKETFLNNENVSEQIRSEDINQNISVVAANGAVRDILVKSQRLIGQSKDMILDGRDIGTVVFPNADYKFYIDASSDVRAKRRVSQNKRLGINESFETIKASIENRDEMDRNREIGPLKCADDAIVIDTSNINLKQTIAILKKEMGK
ncbi:(d)CMP kinase [Mollicutes bacterium LVI A0078]|nr:(d)CMP kinase [Mollicutes bacterium LVI A0075]WOO91113.1 (d)CMP kinase [Mollicutes bacterium LVI A0078]